MGVDETTKQRPVAQVAGLISTVGRVVKQRIGEFTAEADEELRGKLADAQRDLDDELKNISEEPECKEPDAAESEAEQPSPAEPEPDSTAERHQ